MSWLLLLCQIDVKEAKKIVETHPQWDFNDDEEDEDKKDDMESESNASSDDELSDDDQLRHHGAFIRDGFVLV